MPWVKRVQWWALVVGGVCTLIFGILGELDNPPAPSLAKVVVGIAYVLSRLALAMFYVLTIVRVAQVRSWQRRLGPMAAAGRMTLTNYLMQTSIATTIFMAGVSACGTRSGQLLDCCLPSPSSSSSSCRSACGGCGASSMDR